MDHGDSKWSLLLSLLFLSCMIEPVREVVNKHCSLSSAFSTNQTMTSYPFNVETGSINNSKLRECSVISSKYSLRESSILSNASSIPYYRRMEINNNFLEENYTNPVDSSHLSYAKTAKVDEPVSIATNKKADSNSQCVDNEVPALKRVSKPHGKVKDKKIKSNDPTSLEHMSNNVCNTQITYDNNQTVDLESWDSKFNSILLHGSMEQLAWKNWQQMLLTSRSLSDILGNTFSMKKLNKVRLIALLI